MEDEKVGLLSLAECVEHFSRAFLNAATFPDRVHFAAHIFDHLRMIEAEVESALKGQPRQVPEEIESPQESFPQFESSPPRQEQHQTVSSGSDGWPAAVTKQDGHEKLSDRHLPTFRNLTLVQAGEALLRDHTVLHGKDLERLLKERGYRSKAEHFQKMLQATFTRDGRFENVGLNRWRLKQPVSNGLGGDGAGKEAEGTAREPNS